MREPYAWPLPSRAVPGLPALRQSEIEELRGYLRALLGLRPRDEFTCEELSSGSLRLRWSGPRATERPWPELVYAVQMRSARLGSYFAGLVVEPEQGDPCSLLIHRQPSTR